MQGPTAEWKNEAIRRAVRALRVVVLLVPVAIVSGVLTTVREAPSSRDAITSSSGISVGRDLQVGPGPNNDLVGRNGWLRSRLGIDFGTAGGDVATLGEAGRERDRERQNSAPSTTPNPNDIVTLRITRQQAEQIIQILRATIADPVGSTDPNTTTSGSLQISTPSESTRRSLDDSSKRPSMSEASALSLAAPAAAAATTAPPSNRLSTATPLILTFAGATAVIVILMVYSGILLIRAGATSGGAKLEFIGLKIDAKGSGIAAIACGSLVLLATFRPLIEAVVTLSQN